MNPGVGPERMSRAQGHADLDKRGHSGRFFVRRRGVRRREGVT